MASFWDRFKKKMNFDITDVWNPFAWGDKVKRAAEWGWDEASGAAGEAFDAMGGGPGARAAAEAQSRAAELQLQGMREAIASHEGMSERARALQREMFERGFGLQGAMYEQSRSDLEPFRHRGIKALDDYRNLISNMDQGQLRRERDEATERLNAQLAGMGMSNSSVAARAHSLMNTDYLSRMQQQRIAAMQPLLGVGPNMASQQASGALGYGASAAGGANAYGASAAGAMGQLGAANAAAMQGGYGNYARGVANAGQLYGMGMNAPWTGAANAIGLGLEAYRTFFPGPR